jgi:hypothetical protein
VQREKRGKCERERVKEKKEIGKIKDKWRKNKVK